MKLKYIAIIAALASIGLSSCDDFLDKVPDTRVELNSPEKLRLLMVSGYTETNYGILTELMTDNMIDNNSTSSTGVRYNLPAYGRQDDEAFAWEPVVSDTGSDSPSGIWEGCYHAIATCNAVLEGVAKLEEEGRGDEVSAVKGEALVSRAYHYFVLANVFCMPYRGPELSKQYPGVPYVTEPETTVLVHYDRGNLADLYANIEKDLEAGLPLINDGSYEVPKYHFNKAAAHAFAARFYLFTRQYEKCVEHADQVFGGPGMDPSGYMTQIWAQTNLYYLSDFGRYYTDMTQQRNLMLIPTYSQAWRHFIGGLRYACNREAKRATIQGPGPTWEKCRYSSSATKESFSLNPCFLAMSFVNGKQEYGTYFGAAVAEFFEYTDKVSGIGYTHIVRSEFTGEETLLCRAEAKLYLNDIEGCVADLTVWDEAHKKNSSTDDRTIPLTRECIEAFYATDKDGFGIVKPLHIDEVYPGSGYSVNSAIEPYLQCVLHFRRIENIHNGMRWFDIKRYGLEITHVIGTDRVENLTMLDSRKAIQIPAEVIAAGMEPNERLTTPSNSDDAVVAKGYYKKVD